MTARLPDVALAEPSAILCPLDSVGMAGLEVPVHLNEPGALSPVRARADVLVDLPLPHVKGIHMSRLHRLVDGLAAGGPLTPRVLHKLLVQCVESHTSCASRQARLALAFELTLQRPALLTPGLSGWKSYPVRLEAAWHAASGGQPEHFALQVEVSIAYSSTCPCSAALSRQLVQEAFEARFGAQPVVDVQAAAAWLGEHASLATPHSQRSEALVAVRLNADPIDDETEPGLGLRSLIDLAEAALGTPVQTAVKRADEQAFARLNGQNLMYVEDAARRLLQAVGQCHAACRVQVIHRESLHAHDAVASAAQGWAA